MKNNSPIKVREDKGMNNNIVNQQDNRVEARKHISDWFDCFLKADGKHKDLMGKDFFEIWGIKAQGNPELNYRLNQAISMADILRRLGDK